MNYENIYNNLIQRAIDRKLTCYYEVHHIIPRCMGGQDISENLVDLTPEEHLIAHLLLVKIYPSNTDLIYAANWMTNRVKNNKEYGWIRRKFAEEESKRKTGSKRSPESIDKQRNTILEKYRNGYVSPAKGRKLSEEHKKAISVGNTGKTIPVESRTSLEGYIIRYGEFEGLIRYEEDSKKKASFSLEYFISKYGEVEGEEKYKERCEALSIKMTEDNPFKGKHHTEESRKKISESTTGKSKHRSAEHNKKIGLAHKGRKYELIECPHCGKIGGKSIMKRWHFDNCKLNN